MASESGHVGFESVSGWVFTVDVVHKGRIRYGFEHGGGRRGNGVAAEVVGCRAGLLPCVHLSLVAISL